MGCERKERWGGNTRLEEIQKQERCTAADQDEKQRTKQQSEKGRAAFFIAAFEGHRSDTFASEHGTRWRGLRRCLFSNGVLFKSTRDARRLALFCMKVCRGGRRARG